MRVKKFTKFFLPITLLSLFSINNWGQNVFLSEAFDGGLPETWTVTTRQGNNQPSSDWFYTTSGPSGDFDLDPLGSTTAINGWMLFDSDLNCAIETGQDSWLISPVFDASDKSMVILTFQTFYRKFNDAAQIRVGTDLNDLDSWASFDIFADVLNGFFGDEAPSDPINPQFIELDISSATAGQAAVYFAFQFKSDETTLIAGSPTGCGYSWQVDDIQLIEGDPTLANDIRVDSTSFGGDYATPVSQIDTFRFVQSLINAGLNDQNNIEIKVEVQGDNGESFLTLDTLGFLPAGTSIALQLDTFFVPTQVGTYTVTYTITQEEEDQRPQSNTTQEEFLITENLFSKDDGRAVTGVQPGTISGDTYRMGNYYFTPNGGGYKATEASFSLEVNFGESLMGETATVLLYQVPADAAIDDEEIDVVGFATHTFTDEENGDLITLPLLNSLGDTVGVNLEDNGEYVLAVEASSRVFVTVSDNPYYYDLSTVLNDGDGTAWGQFADRTSTARIRMRIADTLLTDVKTIELAEDAINLYPNPTKGLLQIDLALDNVSELVNIRIVDNSGRLIKENNYEGISKELLSFDLSQYPAGIYYAHIRTDEGVKTKRFVLQH